MWWASQKGCQVAGIEPSQDFCSRIQAEGLTCFHDSIENIDPSKLVKYDFVVMLHVLEHFIDPNIVIQRCRELLSDNGLMVIEVPNILKPYRSLDRYFLRYVHLSYFSPQTLTLILRKHGFEVVFADNGDHGGLNPANLFVIAQKSDIFRQCFDANLRLTPTSCIICSRDTGLSGCCSERPCGISWFRFTGCDDLRTILRVG